MANLFSVKDKVVIITGGAGILGRGIAGHLAEEGAKIIILDRAVEAGEQLVADIQAKGGEACFFQTDVLDKETLEQNKKDILAKYGRIDALLNAAGGNMAGATIAPDKTIFDLNIDAFRKVVDLNLFGTVLPTMVFAEVMAQQKEGAIVNFSSESSLRPLTRVVGYGAAKAAISASVDPRSWLRSCQSSYLQPDKVSGRRTGYQVRRGVARKCHRSGILPDRAKPDVNDQSGRFLYRPCEIGYRPYAVPPLRYAR